MAFELSADKVEEAHHFLLLMRVAELPPEDQDVPARLQGQAAFRYAFSGFVGATRAVLALLHEEGSGIASFTRWYVTARERWLRGQVATFFAREREFRLLFSAGASTVAAPPAGPIPRAFPVVPVPSTAIDATGYGGEVRFGTFPGEPATDLCARYLQQLAELVRQAQQLG